jgi:hypothetical protein
LFWQIVTTAAAPTIAVIAAYLLSRKKIQQIHVLVNSRLSEALDEIEKLREVIPPSLAEKVDKELKK